MSRFLVFASLILLASCSQKQSFLGSSHLIPVKSGDDWGYINAEGKYEINPQFSSAYYFTEGLGRISNKDEKYGFVDESGKIIINCQFRHASFFSDGLACVVKENSFPSFIDKEGNTVIELKNAEKAGDFHEDLAHVQIEDKWGYINKNGEFTINTQFDGASIFIDGLAWVYTIDKNKDKKYGFINTQGEFVINPQFDFVSYFRDGHAVFNNGEQMGFINEQGEYTINPQFDFALPFRNGLSIILKGGSYGAINKKGEFIINPQFDQVAFTMLDELIAVKQSDKWGFVDTEGKYQINLQFDDIKLCFDQMAAVESAGKIGLIDKDGKYIVNPQFDAIAEIDEYGQIYGLTNSLNMLETDYFDAGGFVNLILKGNDLFKVGPEANYGDVAKNYPDSVSRSYSSSIKVSDNAVLNKYFQHEQVDIDDLEISFDGRIYETKTLYKTTTNGWGQTYRQYAGTEKVYHDSVKVSKVSFSLDAKGKGSGKAKFLAESLGSSLSKGFSARSYPLDDENEGEYIFFSANREVFIYLKEKYSSTVDGFVSFDQEANQAVYEKLEEKKNA